MFDLLKILTGFAESKPDVAASASPKSARVDMDVFDSKGQPKKLGKEIAKGGEGVVYALPDLPGRVAKIYHKEKLQQYSAEFSQKMEKMVGIGQQFESMKHVCWPRLCIYDAQKNWIGYAMRRARGVPMSRMAHAVLYQKHFPNLDRIQVVRALLNLIKTIQQLHAKGVCIGDYNLENFLCDPKTMSVAFIDCDSYQVSIGGRHFPCTVGSPDFTPPEHQGKDFSSVVRNAQSEAFSAAIMFFRCLMLGQHPYSKQGGDDPATNIRKGYFPYGPDGGRVPKGAWSVIWSHMPYKVKSLFIQTFKEGAKNLAKRPSLDDWKRQFSAYAHELQKNWHNREVRPTAYKSGEYRGKSKSVSKV